MALSPWVCLAVFAASIISNTSWDEFCGTAIEDEEEDGLERPLGGLEPTSYMTDFAPFTVITNKQRKHSNDDLDLYGAKRPYENINLRKAE